MHKSLIEKIALFYYFCFLDESKAQYHTEFTVKKILKTIDSRPKSLKDADLVKITDSVMQKMSHKLKPTNLAYSTDFIQLPQNSDWGPWFEFRKIANDLESRALIYSKILKINDEDIAKGLGIPVGTVRYRVGNGLKTIGQICAGGKST